MLNVIDITSRLAKMSDPQLRQYAQIHKDDPYTLALAAAENKRRVQLRASGQQQAAQQPTVADQAIAQMGAPAPMPQQAMAPQPQLPEQQGIGMLPAQNVAGMADGGIAGYGDSYADEYANGGIVAFKDKGFVDTATEYLADKFSNLPTLPGWNMVAQPMFKGATYGEEARRSLESPDTSSATGRIFAPIRKTVSDFLSTPSLDPATQQQLENLDKQARALSARRKALTGTFGFQQQNPAQQAEVAQIDKQMNDLRQQGEALKNKTEKAAASPEQGQPKPATPAETYSSITAPQPKPAAQTQTSKAQIGTKTTLGTGTTKDGKAAAVIEKAPDFTPSQPGDLDKELKRLQKMSPGTKAYDDLSAKIKQGYTDLEKAREEGRPKDKAFAGLEALLGKEEDKAKGKEARNFNMALVNAGLAIAGGKSQYALQNIAEGAQVGTKQYQEGLEKLEAAALERRKQAAMIEEARRAEARGDWKEAQQFKQKAFEADLGVKQAQIAAVQDLYKTDLKTAADIVNNQNTLASADRRSMFEQQQQTLRAREQNVAHLQGQRIMASAYGARADQRGQITPALMLKEYNDLISANPLAKKQYPTFESYMVAIQQASQGGKDPYAGWGNLQVTSPK